jgi:hypothetical protein
LVSGKKKSGVWGVSYERGVPKKFARLTNDRDPQRVEHGEDDVGSVADVADCRRRDVDDEEILGWRENVSSEARDGGEKRLTQIQLLAVEMDEPL